MTQRMRKPSPKQGERWNIAFAITSGDLWFPLDELAMHICKQEMQDYGGYDTYRHCRFYSGSYIITRLLTAGIPGNRIDAYQFVDGEWIKLGRDHWEGPVTVLTGPPPMRPRMTEEIKALGMDI